VCGVHKRLPAFAGGLEGFHYLDVVAHSQSLLRAFRLGAASPRQLVADVLCLHEELISHFLSAWALL